MEQARCRYSETDVTLRWVDMTEPRLLAENNFDCILYTLVLQHVKRLDQVFVEGRRVLRSGGRLYLRELHLYRQLEGTHANFCHEDPGDAVTVRSRTLSPNS